ncbi:MAG TPA: NAD(P)-dependent oxidoreductase [Stellaceae bacterium]|nr:NAD(P)-dependent oxidoreductase [Stellaceae bacterium]
MRVAVIGATGVLGRHVVPRLVERGHEVRALVRTEAKASVLRRLGIDCVLGDILGRASLDAAVAGCAAALHLATSVPRPGAPRDYAANDRIRREGTAHLIAACRAAGVERYVQQSIAHLVAGTGDRLVDETAPMSAAGAASSAADMEAQVRASGLRWSILRGGAFYGPLTGRDEEWRGLARAGKLVLPGDGSGYISLIHEMDMADAVVLAAELAPPAALLAIVDDEPVTFRALYAHIAALEGGPEPRPGGSEGTGSFRVSNARARAALGWRPRFRSYRSGFV